MPILAWPLPELHNRIYPCIELTCQAKSMVSIRFGDSLSKHSCLSFHLCWVGTFSKTFNMIKQRNHQLSGYEASPTNWAMLSYINLVVTSSPRAPFTVNSSSIGIFITSPISISFPQIKCRLLHLFWCWFISEVSLPYLLRWAKEEGKQFVLYCEKTNSRVQNILLILSRTTYK